MLIKYNDILTLKKYEGNVASKIAIIDPEYFLWLTLNTNHTLNVELTNAVTTNFCGVRLTGDSSVTFWKKPKLHTTYKGDYPCKIKVYDWSIHETSDGIIYLRIIGENNHAYTVFKNELALKPDLIFSKPLTPKEMEEPSFNVHNLPFKIGDSFEETFDSGNPGRSGVIEDITPSTTHREGKRVHYASSKTPSRKYVFLYNETTYKKFKFFNLSKNNNNEVCRSIENVQGRNDERGDLFPCFQKEVRVQETTFPSSGGFGNNSNLSLRSKVEVSETFPKL